MGCRNVAGNEKLRILLVAHAIPSQNVGGVEHYTLRLARMFAQSHEVTLCVPDSRSAPPRLEIERSIDGFDLAYIRVRRRKVRFLDLYRYEAVDEAFVELLETFQPDVVHVHHIISLSTGVITESSKRGIPVVFTIHDFWMNCPRGQRIAYDGTICRSIDRDRCIACLKPQWQGIHRAPRQAPRRLIENLVLGEEAGRRDLAEYDRLMHEVFGEIDRVISPSRAMLSDFSAYGVDERKMVLLRYCLDGPLSGADSALAGADGALAGPDRPRSGEKGPIAPVARNPHSPEADRTDGTVRIGYLGTLIPTKGVHILTEAFGELGDLSVSLDIHGAAPPYRGQRDYLRKLERRVAGLSRVRFRGPYERNALPAILKGLDLVVVPSMWMENFPQTALEALMAGVPVLAADHGGLAEIVRSGVNGLKFRPNDPSDLAKKLRMLVLDTAFRRRLAGRGIELPTPDEHRREHFVIYREVIAERAGKSHSPMPPGL